MPLKGVGPASGAIAPGAQFEGPDLGTSIELTVGGITIDWSKNNMGMDYGFLFQEGDQARRPSDQINYEYYAEHPEMDLAADEAALVRPLARVLPRLDLLGHTLDTARAEYEATTREELEICDRIGNADASRYHMTFEEFCAFASRQSLSSLSDTYVEFNKTDRYQEAKGRFIKDAEEIARIPAVGRSDAFWSERSYFGSRICILSSYSMLQIFGQSDANAGAEVVWQYGPLVQSGWANEECFRPGALRSQIVLVATEGTSDSRVIRKALDILQPDIADFFRFIDVDERHPFWGPGNFVKFAEVLIRIDVQNHLIFLLNNDAEGLDASRRLQELRMPQNMRAMVLPDLAAFRRFPARGPEGVNMCDINGRAAAIECYLDLDLPGRPPAQVLWSSYKKEVDAWQGVLEYKETYMRRFLDQQSETLLGGSYDISKLEMVLKALLAEATKLASSA
jgi:hypothetical protein